MDYDTFGGTTTQISEYINKLNDLKNCLTTELLESDAGNFDAMISKIDECIQKLETVESDIKPYSSKMQEVDEYFQGW